VWRELENLRRNRGIVVEFVLRNVARRRDVTISSVYSFLGLGDGVRPLGLVLGPDGAVYGTTAEVGSGSTTTAGTFFRIAPSGALTTLFVFRNSLVGRPGPLMVTHDGAMFGVATLGGPTGYGTVFQADTNGALTIVHAFTADDAPSDIRDPIVEAADGVLWGTNGTVPPYGGIVFKLTRAGAYTRFQIPPKSLFSGMRALVPASDGSVYGTLHYERFPNHGEYMAHVSATGTITRGDQFFLQHRRNILAAVVGQLDAGGG
jgi:uncharacterized repeat protein (TIGR03803 family)